MNNVDMFEFAVMGMMAIVALVYFADDYYNDDK